MKVLNEKQTVVIEGALKSQNVGVKDDEFARAELCKILRDSLYLDKVTAAIRESLSNAVDEHRRFNIVAPVKITIPDWSNSRRFAIRDFAKGLSEEDIFNVFFQFLNSTKRDCSITTGCKGLGSKAFAALTDEYTVTSWHGGEKKVYLGLVQGNALTASLASCEKSDEPCGIEVACNLNEQKAYEVERKFKVFIKDFLPFYDNFDCNIDISEFRRLDFVRPDIGVEKSEVSRVIQRGISYKLQWENAPKAAIYVSDGAILDIHPSREFLEETDRNKDIINAIVLNEGTKLHDELMKGAPINGTDYEKWCFSRAHKDDFKFIRGLGIEVEKSFSAKEIGVSAYKLSKGYRDVYSASIEKRLNKFQRKYGSTSNFVIQPNVTYLFCTQHSLVERRATAIIKHCNDNGIKTGSIITGVSDVKEFLELVENTIEGGSAAFVDVSEVKMPPIPKGERPTGYLVSNNTDRIFVDDGVNHTYYIRGICNIDSYDISKYESHTGKEVLNMARGSANKIPAHWIKVTDEIARLKNEAAGKKILIPDKSRNWNKPSIFVEVFKKHYPEPEKGYSPFCEIETCKNSKKFVDFYEKMSNSKSELTKVAFAIIEEDRSPTIARQWANARIKQKIDSYEHSV